MVNERLRGWLACVFVGGLGARPENEPDPRPTIAGVTTMSPPPPISFSSAFPGPCRYDGCCWIDRGFSRGLVRDG